MSHLSERTVVVTGAASGFGRELALRTAARGANVGACDVDAAGLADLAGESTEIGTVDVTDLAAHLTDPHSIGYAALAPGQSADQVLHAIDQPWG